MSLNPTGQGHGYLRPNRDSAEAAAEEKPFIQLSVHAHSPRREAVVPSTRFAPPPAPRGADGRVPPHAIVLDALRPIGVAARVPRGRQIFVEGETAAHWYWLASGAVQVCSFAEDGKRHVAELVLPGDL